MPTITPSSVVWLSPGATTNRVESGIVESTNAPLRVRSTAPLVNRQREFAWLTAHCDAAERGVPGVCLLHGDAGIGKSRLVRELAARSHGRSAHVGIGRGHEYLSAPYLPLAEALREGPAAAAGALLRPDRVSAPNRAERDGEEEHARVQLFTSVAAALIDAAAEQPLVIVLEDLHWADPSTLDLLGHLVFAAADASGLRPVHLLLVLTYRSSELSERLRPGLSRIAREAVSESLELEGLDQGDTSRLVEAHGVGVASHQLVSAIQRATEGNPLFVGEVLRELVADGGVQQVERYAAVTREPQLQLPADVSSAISRRLTTQSSEVRRMLERAAVIGELVDEALLRATASEEEGVLESALREAIDTGFLERDGRTLRFQHGLQRRVVLEEAAADRVEKLHRLVAEELESRPVGHDDPGLGVAIAEHLFRAGTLAPVEQRVRAARRAADDAARVFAWGESGRWYAAAADAARGILSETEVADLDYSAGLSFNHDWDAGPCLAHYDRAHEAYARRQDAPGIARTLNHRLRATFTFGGASYGESLDLEPLREAVASLGEGAPVLRGMAMATLAEAHWTARETEASVRMAEAALELGRREGDAHLSRNASVALGLARVQQMDLAGAVQAFLASRSHARTARDPWLAIAPMVRATTAQIQLGRIAEAVAVGAEALAEGRRMHDVAETSMSLCDHALLAVLRGRFSEAEAVVREAMMLSYRAQYPWSGVLGLATLAAARWLRGETLEAEDALSALAEPGGAFEDPSPAILILVEVYRTLLRLGHRSIDDDERARLGGLARALGLVGPDANAIGPHCAMVEIAAYYRLPELVEVARPFLELAVERGVVFSSGWPFSVERSLALAERLVGDDAGAERHLRHAASEMDRLDARPELGRSLVSLAGLLLDRGDDAGRAEAQVLCDRALALFESLAMPTLAEEVLVLAKDAELDVSPAPSAPRSPAIDAGDVARRMARGEDLSRIAGSLILSPRSANEHLLRAFTPRPESARGFTPAGVLAKLDDTAAVSPRVLTILITDIVGFTPLIHGLGDEVGHAVIKAHNRIVRECLTRRDGVEVAHTGDGLMVSFEAPSNALRCATEIHRAFAAYTAEHPEAPVRVRIGIHLGETRSEEHRLFGTAVNMAARVCACAEAEEIIVSKAVRDVNEERTRRFESRGEVELKGLPGRYELFEMKWRSD